MYARIKISVNTDILIIEFYGHIENISKISMNIFIKISVVKSEKIRNFQKWQNDNKNNKLS